MDVKGPDRRDMLAGRIADRQYGVAARAQLLSAGVSRESILGSLEAERLRPMFRGVYAVGHAAVGREAWWQAALLACGAGAVLSHHSAAQLWRLRHGEQFPISVIVPGDRGRKHDRIHARRMALDRSEWMVLDGLRLTTPARTIVDMAGELGPRQMRELVERAQDLRRFDANRIEAVLGRHRRRPGCRPLLHLLPLLKADADGAKSYLERLFLKLVREARLPEPDVNAMIENRERDFVWREQRLVVEVDGYAHHSSRKAMRRDKRRDRVLTAALWRPARFTYEEVAFEPTATADELASLLRSSSP